MQVPEYSGSVSVDYQTRPMPAGRLAFHTDYSYASSYWNTPGALLVSSLLPNYSRPTSDTHQLAARLAWREISVGAGQLEVAAWGKNLTNNSSIVYGFDGCALGTGFCAYRTPPRTYGLEVRYNYQ